MTAAPVDLGLGGERVRLLGARAAYLPAHAALLLADLHLGKGQAFRRLAGPAHDRLRLPCFRVGAPVGVLPAFGAFTGGHPVRPAAGERLFVADGESVHELPPVRDALRA